MLLLSATNYAWRALREDWNLGWIIVFVLAASLGVVTCLHGWHQSLMLRIDDHGVRLLRTLPLFDWIKSFGRSQYREEFTIPWAEIRSARFVPPEVAEPEKRTILFDTRSGERPLVIVMPGIFRLKEPEAFLAAMRVRGFDLTWPQTLSV